MIWNYPHVLWTLLAVPIFLWLKLLVNRNRQLRAKKVNIKLNKTQEQYRLCTFLLCLIFSIIALAEPKLNKGTQEVSLKGRQIIFLLDVSRSMQVDDLLPDRLQRAKQEIINAIPSLQGYELGLITFAGSAIVRSPLTVDYNFFSQAVKAVRINDSGKGGTLMGDALRLALTFLDENTKNESIDIILLTDGDDQASFPLEAAQKVGDTEGNLIIFGLGDSKNPQQIPKDDETFIQYDGELVYSKVNHNLLEKMASSTHLGRYIPIAEGSFDLAAIYKAITASQNKGKGETFLIEDFLSLGWYFLALAFFFLTVYLILEFKAYGIFLKKNKTKQ